MEDLVVVKYSPSNKFYSALNVTKLDIPDTCETIKIAITYKVDGEVLGSYLSDSEGLDRADVVYHDMRGWQKPTTDAGLNNDLPKQGREYIECIMDFLEFKIK